MTISPCAARSRQATIRNRLAFLEQIDTVGVSASGSEVHAGLPSTAESRMDGSGPKRSLWNARRVGKLLALVSFVFLLGITYHMEAWTPQAVETDPLVRMPGTQPSQGVSLEGPNRCLNCHADYNQAVEPGFNWKGSMMAQSARDPIFWAGMTVAAQDSVWALGNPNAADLCERCHFPAGWLGGRSDPPNASAMTGTDFDGVHCEFCHRAWDPFFEDTYNGTRESSDWSGYWDEALNTGPGSGTLSQSQADATYAEDGTLAGAIKLFSGEDFFLLKQPRYNLTYRENASGQYFVSPNAEERGSFADATPKHSWFYSRTHKSKYFCGTCHDVSNPALANSGLSGLPDLSGGTHLISEEYSASRYFHVERTFSEFMLSAYGRAGGAATNPEFQSQGAPDITRASKCQDCHMRDVRGVACNKAGTLLRPDQSTEHPNSGVPLHDMTGGNAWISRILASLDPDGGVYDSVNAQLLDQGPSVLTLDLNAGESPKVNGPALLAGADRAIQQLRLAATIKNLNYADGTLSFRIQNNSGHKLISGFPEGRRMFVNVKAYDQDGNLIYEVNPYDAAAGTLKGLPNSPGSPPLGGSQVYEDTLVYESHPRSNLTGENETFHFVLATGRYKDNRIPPKGFDISGAAERLSEPVWAGLSDTNYFTAAEYAGGYDDVTLQGFPAGTQQVDVTLFYQGTSREYVEFLRNEINGTGGTLSSPTPSGETAAYIIQTDPFFAGLKNWGEVIWQLWRHNHGLDGSGVQVAGIVPVLMATASTSGGVPGCGAPAPALISAEPGDSQVTLTWSNEHSGDVNVIGYSIYYDEAGKSLLVAQVGLTTTYDDTGLTNGQLYSYKVTSRYSGCESNFSNILSATPSNPGSSAPSITSFTPASGPEGTEVTITGANFTGTTAVSFHLTAATSFTIDSDSQVRATVPSGATTGKISVTNANGTGTSAGDFTVTVVASEVSLSPASLTFGDQDVSTTSAPQAVTLTNTSTTALGITSIVASGDFAQTNTCGSTVAAGASCTINVTFTPTAAGTLTGTVTVSSDAPDSPHVVSLSGTGIQAVVTLSATNLSFESLPLGVTSTAQAVMLSNSGTTTLSIVSINVSGDFTESHNCGTSLGAGTACTIDVKFAPTAVGTRSGSLTITDDAPGSPHSVALSGVGADFALATASGSSSSATLTAGATASYNLQVVPTDLVGSVALACAFEGSVPGGARCSVTPSTIALNGTDPAPFEVNVSTTARSLAAPRVPLESPRTPSPPGNLLPALLALLMMLAGVALCERRGVFEGSRDSLRWAPLGTMLLLVLVWASCGGGGGTVTSASAPQTGTPAGTYTLTVTGTAAGASRTATLTLKVN
jgi:hypothetical protein